MKVIFYICTVLMFCSFLAATEAVQIPLGEVQEIALRQADEYWGKVYAAEPIPYYDRQGSLVAWQFNFSIGQPFPAKEELQQRCRNSAAKLWDESWNGEGFANLLMGARTDKPVIISFSKGLSYDFTYLSEMERLAKANLGSGYKLTRMVHVNMGSRWFVVNDGNKEHYIKAFSPPKVVGYEEFLTLTEGLETPLKPMDFSSLWQEYFSGRTDDRAAAYIPYPEKMPFYQWVVGCSPCSGSMLSAWWDNMSAVSTDDYSNLIKHHFEAWDDVQDHTDFHISDAVSSIGYYMETNDEGGTHYYNIDDGMQDFFNSRDYGCWTDSDDLEWEFLWDYDDLFYAARGQIRAGKPTLLAIPGHSICGMGYSTNSHYLLLHDPNSDQIESWYQTEFNMVTYVHPSTSGWSSHVEIISPDGGQYWHSDGGGEQWYADALYEIKWAGDFDAGTYAKIWYHLDKGLVTNGWTLITANTPNDGSYDWLIPSGISSTKCRIRVEIYNSANQLIGSDGSYGNFTISSGGGNSTLVSGTPVSQGRNPVYYRVPDNENSWVVVGTLRHNDSPAMALKLYDSINLGTQLASSEYTSMMNLIAIDRNHLPDNEYGLKVYNTNGYIGGFTEFDGGNNQLSSGLNTGFSWSDLHSVKMWDLQLTPGSYLITLDMISGSHNLGMALFSSQGGNYIKNLSQAIANSDASPAGGDESFLVDITTADRYGLAVYCKDYILMGSNSNYTINVGTPGLWTGSVSRIWNVAGNWSNNQIPSSTSNIVIPSGLYNYPYISGGFMGNCRSLTIQSGAILEIAQGSLSVHGGYTRVYGKIKISSASAVLELNGHLVWYNGSEFEETAGGTIYLGGDWHAENGSTVEINLSTVNINGVEDSMIYSEDSGNHFGNLVISKSLPRSTSYSGESSTSLKIDGNFTVLNGSSFYTNYSGNVDLKGNLVSAGGITLTQGRLRFTSGSTQYITVSGIDIINDLELINGTTLDLSSNLTVRGSLYLNSGFINAHSRSINIYGNWEQSPYFNSYIADAAGSVMFVGDQNSTCNGVNFKKLVINKSYSAEVVIGTDKQVQCASLDWTSGVIRVNGGSLYAADLADLNIKGSYILESGIIDLTQDSAQYVDLNADLNISGGTFTIHGGYNAPSEWAYTESCQVTMTGGELIFADNGIYLSDTGHYLGIDISNGVIKTSKDFKVERPGFNPTGGTIEMIGSGDAVFYVNSPSKANDLEINKAAREGELRTNKVTISENTEIEGYCRVLTGSTLKVDNNVEFKMSQYLDVYGILEMSGANAVIDVYSATYFRAGSVANLSNGTLKMHNTLFLDSGLNLPASVKCIFQNGAGVGAYIYIYQSSQLGTLQYEMTPGNLIIAHNNLNLSGDLVIKPSSTITVTTDINVGGKIDIWNTGSLIMNGSYNVTTTNLYNSGLLNLPNTCSGALTVSNTFLQYSTGQLALHGGSLVMNAAYNGSYYAFGGTTAMSGGTLQITNNGMQIGTSGFNFSGGTIKLGWGFQANSPNTFQANNGSVEFIGTSSATVSLGSGNYFPAVTINKSGTSGSVYLGTDVSIKYNLSLNGGKLYVNQHILSVQKDISFNSGYLYGNNANDEIQVGGSWTNNGGTAYFIEGSGLVKFISSVNTKQIKSTESFNNLSLDTNSEYVYVTAGKTIAVAGNLEILSGRFRPLDGTALNVSGNLNISGASAYLDQNFRRETANTQVHIYGNCIINNGKLLSIDPNGNIADDMLTIDGDLTMTGGELNTLDLNMTVHGNFSTTTASSLATRGSSFINDAPYTGAWQYVNCPWITYGNTIEFPNKGLQFISGASLDNNSYTVIKLGRGLYATASGVFVDNYGTFEFIGTNQANINLGGGNSLPAVKINKTGTSLVLSTNAVIMKELIIQSGNFNSNNYQLTVKGSWTNSVGTSGYSCGTSEVIFDTSGYSETITGNQTFYKLTFNHTDTSKGITLNGSTSTVSNDLTVSSGRFTIGSSSVMQVNGNVSVANTALLYLQGELRLKGNLTDNNGIVGSVRGFYAPQGSLLTLNGTSTQVINVASGQIYLGSITLDKPSGSFQPAKSMVCSGDVTVQNGTWGYGASGLIHNLQGDLLIGSGGNWSDDAGTIVFNGTDNATLSNSGVASFKNLIIDKTPQRITGASVNLNSNLSLSTAGTITVEGGIFNLGSFTLQTNGAVNVNSDAKLSLGAGAILKMASGYTLTVNSGGELSLLGSSSQKAKLTRVSGNYGLTVASGGVISANYAIFEYLNTSGIYIQSGATVNPTNALNNCTFQYGQAGGTLLKIDNNQQFTVNNAAFPTNAGSGAKNVTKTLNQGTVAFVGETGTFAGSAFENDMYQRINWSTDVPQFVTYQTDFPFGNVPYTQSSTQYMMISNPGSALLVGSIVTPPNFSVALWGRTETIGSQLLPADKPQYEFSRNTLEFSVPIGGSNTYAITFSPTEPIPYAGTIVITHNAVNSPANITVSGNGRGSRIVLDHDFYNIDVQPGQTTHKLLSISNTGVDSLSYSGWVSYSRNSRSTLLSTGFEEGCPPTGWTQQQTLGIEAHWFGSTSTVHPSGTAPYEGSHLGYFNSYTAHSGNRARLESPVIDASDYTGLNLSFWMFHDSGYPTYYDTLQVQVSVNGGAWVDAGFYIMRPTAPYTWREHTIDLSAYDRSSSLRIGFLGKSAYGNDIHIDAINLTGNYQMPTDWITLNGAQSVSGYVWPQDTPATVDIAVDAAGLPTGWYYNQLHLLTNDPANPEELVWLYVKIGNPAYSFDPSQLDFGWVETGQSDSLSLQILNTGQIGLSGTVTVPTGYSIFLGSGPRNREGNRNTLDFYASPGIAAEFTVSFSPTEAIDYNGQLVITSNAGADQYINLIGKGASLPVLTTAVVTNIGVTTATGGGNVSSTGNLPLTERGICWYYMDDPTIDYYHGTAPGSTGEFTVNMADLLPGYNYRVRAYAINALGIAYGTQVSFDTPGPSIIATPDSLPDFGAVALGETSAPQTISISGESLAGPVTIDSPQGYQISLQENSGYSMQLELNPVDYILALTTIYVKFSPIERGPWPGALVIQSSGLDNVFVQMTGTGVELPTVETATVVYITTESATVNCRIVDDGGDPVDFSGVVYGLYPDPSIDDNILDLGAQTGWYAAELTNLVANSSYYVRSFAVNVAGLAYGNQVQFNTLPIPQISLDTSLLDPFGSIVVGQSSMPDTLIVSAQQLTDDLLITAPNGFGLSLNPLGRDFAAQLSLVPVTGNILPTMIYVRFAPSVGGNLSNYLLSESANLLPAQIMLNGIGVVAPTLSTGDASDIGSNSVTLSGSIDHNGFGAITACGFCFGTSQNPDLSGSHTLDLVDSGEFTVHLDTLQPDTIYFVRSYATNAAGTSYGNEVSFQTLLGFLEAPQNLQISFTMGELQLSWNPVPNANSYYIYRSLDPYAENWGTPFAQTDQTHWEDSETSTLYFYKVSASSEETGR